MVATWIWYPGDFEMMLFNKCMVRRFERDVPITPFWRMDSYYKNVKFMREFTLQKPDRIRVLAEGIFNIFIEGLGYIKDFGGVLELPAGTYCMSVLVYNETGLPCIYVEGNELVSDEKFTVTCQDHRNYPAGCWNFGEHDRPNAYRLPTRPARFLSSQRRGGGMFCDFGHETMARLVFTGLTPGETVEVSYGESEEEALDYLHSEQFDRFTAPAERYTLPLAKAFRYVYFPVAGKYSVSLEEELPTSETKCRFETSDTLLQNIWDTAIRTNELTCREFFLDGIKRDRWSWSGDARQSELIAFYSTFDTGIVKRTLRALGGKLPVVTHINHIMDYTQYWLISLYEYWFYTGDRAFIEEMFPLAEEYVRFCSGRTTAEGFLDAKPNDWIFIDWAEMDNSGETSFEQILFAAGLNAIANLAEAIGRSGEQYREQSRALFLNAVRVFWKDGAFVHGRRQGILDSKVTKYANLFAILHDLADETMREDIIKNVLLNDDIPKITTPYMRFYELIVLSRTGNSKETMEALKTYWGGMLAAGADTFWEKFDPDEQGAEKYAMYGRPYGKSLCHAWGATPIYLIAACLFGIRPLEVGYKRFVCAPQVEVLPDCSLTVPTPCGSISVQLAGGTVTVEAIGSGGIVRLPVRYAHASRTRVTAEEEGIVSLRIEAGERVIFTPKEETSGL